MQPRLVFANNAISLCFFLSFLIIDFCFLIFAIIPEVFNPIGKPTIPLEISIREAKAGMNIHTVTGKERVQCNLESEKSFCSYYSIIYFGLFL